MAVLYHYYSTSKKTIPCNHLLCRTDCKNYCKPEDILEIGYNLDLNKFEFFQVYLLDLLLEKNTDYWKLLLPWIIELAKIYPKIGALLCIKTNDVKSIFNIYYEIKYNLSFQENENLKEIFKILKGKIMQADLLNDIRKTDEFIKFIPLVLSKINNYVPINEIELDIQSFFCYNTSVSLPWEPSEKCIGIECNCIKHT